MSEQQALLTPEQEVEIREAMELDPVLNHLSPVEYAKAKGYLTEVEDTPGQQAPAETPVTPENTEEPVIEPEVEFEEEQDEEEEVSVFQSKKGTKVNFKDESEAKGYIKDKLGIDVNTPAGYAKLVEAFNKQRTNAQKATELEKYKEDIETAFAEMPPEIVKAIEAYNNGSDWKQAIMSAPGLKLDFNKDLESQDRWALLEAYAPDELTQEEFEDDPNSKEVLRLLRVAEKAFRLDKQQNDRQVAEAKRVQTEREKSFKNSALSSLEQVKADFPGIDDKELKKLEKVLTGGGLGSEFFNKDGTYRVDAAKKLALIQYAPTEIERLSKKLTKLQQKNKELSDQLAGVVSRGRDTVADEKGGDSSMKSNEQSIVPDWLRNNTHKI
jgi:hypothetical protein